MRLIDADELIEAIDSQDNWLSQMDLSQFNVYSLINTMPTVERPQGEWIPIGERLPDYMEDTLVTIQVNNREPKVRSGFYARGCFHNDNGDVWNWNDPEVKAWMPLPEPYKEAEND